MNALQKAKNEGARYQRAHTMRALRKLEQAYVEGNSPDDSYGQGARDVIAQIRNATRIQVALQAKRKGGLGVK